MRIWVSFLMFSDLACRRRSSMEGFENVNLAYEEGSAARVERLASLLRRQFEHSSAGC